MLNVLYYMYLQLLHLQFLPKVKVSVHKETGSCGEVTVTSSTQKLWSLMMPLSTAEWYGPLHLLVIVCGITLPYMNTSCREIKL